jgi:hypothetical protein
MAEESELVKARVALITEIQEAALHWKGFAESAAVSAIRKQGDTDAVSYAREMLAKHDACQAMADRTIKLVWKYWPKDGAQRKTDPP